MSNIKVLFHPVVMFNITDHITRDNVVFGGLLGTVKDKTVEIFFAFEFNYRDGRVDRELFKEKFDEYKNVYSFLEVVGVYTSSKEAGKIELDLLKEVNEITKHNLEVCIICNSQNTKERPFGLYQVVKGAFVPIQFGLSVSAQEKIALDVISDPSSSGTEISAAETYADQITNLIQDLTQLENKVNILLKYLKGYKDIPLEKRNCDIIRKIATAVHLLPTPSESDSSSSSSFSLPFFSRLTESGITLALAVLTQNLSLTEETANIFQIVNSSPYEMDMEDDERGGGRFPFPRRRK